MSLNILVVDDSKSMRSVIKKVIQICDFDVGSMFEAGDGREAIEVVESNWVDLIFSDIHMPNMDGIEFLKRLKQDDLLGAIPVVIISTEGRDQRIQEAFDIGAKAYLKKPFTPEQVKETMMSIVGEEYVRSSEGDLDGCDF